MSRTKIITARFEPATLAAAERVAHLTYRSTGALIEYATRLYIEKNYPLALNADAKLTLSLAEAPIEGQS